MDSKTQSQVASAHRRTMLKTGALVAGSAALGLRSQASARVGSGNSTCSALKMPST